MKEVTKRKILIVGHGAALGGGEQYMLDQATLLSDQGHDVSCIAFEGGALEDVYRERKIALSIQPVFCMDSQKIFKLVSDYDFVIANTMYAVFFAYQAQKYKPTMLILHDCNSFIQNLFLRAPRARQEMGEIRHLFGVSKYHVGRLHEIGQMNAKILNNFVPDTFEIFPKKSFDKVKFLTVANWSTVKGYDLALKAFNHLTEEEKMKLEWHIAGRMENEQACRKFCREVRKESWIYFYETINEKKILYDLYRECEVYLQMSREDSCPLSVMDAAMMQMPLVLSKDTGSNYLAEKGGGWIIDEYDSAKIAETIRYILNHRDILKDIGKRARENYLSNATPDRYIRSLQTEIEEIIEEEKSFFENEDVKSCKGLSEDSGGTLKAENCDRPRIAFYGYNKYAQIECFYHKRNPVYKLTGIYDMSYEKFRKDGITVKNPEDICTEEFDYISIFCVYESTINDIKKFLLEKGVSEDKIHIGVEQILEKDKQRI